jgi:hypothetical protein
LKVKEVERLEGLTERMIKLRDGGGIGSDLEREERESVRARE